jgi:hypothetical protein
MIDFTLSEESDLAVRKVAQTSPDGDSNGRDFRLLRRDPRRSVFLWCRRGRSPLSLQAPDLGSHNAYEVAVCSTHVGGGSLIRPLPDSMGAHGRPVSLLIGEPSGRLAPKQSSSHLVRRVGDGWI